MAVNYKVYQNKRKGEFKDMFYARATHGETMTIKQLAERMQDNCTVKKSDIIAVLTELSEVMKDELQRGNRVKIEGLGLFKIGLHTSPAPTAKEFTASNIKGAHVLFLPESTTDANGKRVKSMLVGLRVKEAEAYDNHKEDDASSQE